MNSEISDSECTMFIGCGNGEEKQVKMLVSLKEVMGNHVINMAYYNDATKGSANFRFVSIYRRVKTSRVTGCDIETRIYTNASQRRLLKWVQRSLISFQRKQPTYKEMLEQRDNIRALIA